MFMYIAKRVKRLTLTVLCVLCILNPKIKKKKLTFTVPFKKKFLTVQLLVWLVWRVVHEGRASVCWRHTSTRPMRRDTSMVCWCWGWLKITFHMCVFSRRYCRLVNKTRGSLHSWLLALCRFMCLWFAVMKLLQATIYHSKGCLELNMCS